jgi:exopolyphosphatase / guanosine-5'-triphosphate,3'-diphosphate pyrophosphatase
MIVSGIDIGTNTVRLLIGDMQVHPQCPDKPILKRLFENQYITRLGEGIISAGRLSERAMNRTVSVLKEFKIDLDRYSIQVIVCVGTSAIREAVNGQDFIKYVKNEIGFDIEVISDREEARRTLLGVENGLGTIPGSLLVVDIGGGSTELILKQQREPVHSISMHLGVVKLVEHYLKSDPPSEKDIENLLNAIDSTLRSAWKSMSPVKTPVIVGTAGTATTLAAMELGMAKYDPKRVQNYQMSLRQVEHWFKKLSNLTVAERCKIVGLEAGREDVIVAGSAILMSFLKMIGAQKWVVSDSGLREGLLVDWWKCQQDH